ncbi:MAG: rhodanese-like domain-containing protein [Massilibacteroides sp.]|nr:rhodanese-like domain-containing protein [Massilibacteroides sp.]MDD4115914.1 rhodanese-like domain-containing protein [Massilibacteroides sp.]
MNKLFQSTPQVDLDELLTNGAELIDVRTKLEFMEAHARSSKNLPLDEIPHAVTTWNKEKTYVLVCASGMRSRTAVSILKRNGIERVYNGGSWIKYAK